MAAMHGRGRWPPPAIVKRLARSIEDMVGKPAPPLPTAGWIGGQPPDVTGKPYLLQFWAACCDLCKEDLPTLTTLTALGATVLGMHPFGTPVEDVETIIRDQQLGYPTFVATKKLDIRNPRIGPYPAGVFPYYVRIDAQGRVAGHGFLSVLLDKYGVALLLPAAGGRKSTSQNGAQIHLGNRPR
jgi:hypothetical protein